MLQVVCEGKPVPVKVDQLDLSKFHLAVTLNHCANSAEGMVLIARATQKSNKLLQKGRAGKVLV